MESRPPTPALIREMARIGISVVILMFSFGVLFFGHDPSLRGLATGLIGTVVGYWLK